MTTVAFLSFEALLLRATSATLWPTAPAVRNRTNAASAISRTRDLFIADLLFPAIASTVRSGSSLRQGRRLLQPHPDVEAGALA